MTTRNRITAAASGGSFGFTIVEVLISLALLAVLLTALAFAMQGSANSYSRNDEISAVTQTARSVLSKMTRDIRASDETTFTGTHITITPVANDSGYPVVSGSGPTQIEYNYQNGNLNYITTYPVATTTYPLITSTERVQLTAFNVLRLAGTDANNVSCTAVITANMTFTVGQQTFNVTASAAPRRNQLW